MSRLDIPLFANILLFALVMPLSAAEMVAEFSESALDTEVWNDCQIDAPPLQFLSVIDGTGAERSIVRIPVDPGTRNKEDCDDAGVRTVSEPVDDLTSPSLVNPSPLELSGVEECPPGGSSQRTELRPRLPYFHPEDEAHWYSLTFRVDGTIPTCGSARWVLAQWKQDNFGAGPFLAQRFDNGVLHVTVQNEDCRCVVAKAEGDFDAAITLMHGQLDGDAPALQLSKPLKCTRSDIKKETGCEPRDLSVSTLGGGVPPLLPDPKFDWVKMTYRVRGGSDGKGQIDVYANDRFVVRVAGMIGYESDKLKMVKFKFGHYRNKVESAASMSVDRVCLSPNVQFCEKDIDAIP